MRHRRPGHRPGVPFDSLALTVRRASDQLWEVVEPLVYRGRRDTFVVPAGFRTDFASVPRLVVWLIPRFGRYTPAAVLHDWLVTTGLQTRVVSSRDADGLFRRVLRELGVPPVRRWLMWCGVRWGALANPLRRSGWWVDAPRLLLLSVLLAPLVVPPGVVVAAALGLYTVVESAVAALLPGVGRRADRGMRL
ncbi:hypothetical protein DMO24_10395 [Modestobacter versicolor]|uniref:DUF1353 domain-containing protein n=1 Tax=Modestobacter versicolor TaxID=429133 RepID=A0A323V9F4_9ACTN|nr:hypothetical protein DMO24_10395 [Modestobacter versicolor]